MKIDDYIPDYQAREAGASIGRIAARRAAKQEISLIPIRRMLDARIEANKAGIDATKQAEADQAIGELIGVSEELRRASAEALRRGELDVYHEGMIRLMFEAAHLAEETKALCYRAALDYEIAALNSAAL